MMRSPGAGLVLRRWCTVERHEGYDVDPRVPILIVGNFLSASGWTVSVSEELAARLSASGWKVLTASDRPQRFDRLMNMLDTVIRKRKEYAVAAVDVFSGRAFIWADAVCAVLRLLRKPYVLTLHGGNLPYFSGRFPRPVRRLLRSAVAVVTPSRYLFEEMSRYREGIILLPNALDLGRYHFRVRSSPRPRLIWVRALHAIYNPCLAVDVVALLAGEFPDIHLTMLGPERGAGSLAAVKDLAARLGVSDRIDLPGGVPKSEVPAWLAKEDILINTTNVDNTPVSVLEALACGLCVVSTNVGGIPYMLTNEQNALLVPPADPAAMATALRRILHDHRLAERLSSCARRTAEDLDWGLILPRWEALLTRVAERPPEAEARVRHAALPEGGLEPVDEQSRKIIGMSRNVKATMSSQGGSMTGRRQKGDLAPDEVARRADQDSGDGQGKAPLRLALFTNKFPIKGDTFFARDVRSLVEAGVSVDIFPMHRIDPRLWPWIPDILDERSFPREHVHGLNPADPLRELSLSSLRLVPRFLGEAASISASALRFGPARLVRSLYTLPLAWAWSRRYGMAYDHIMSYWGNYAATCAYLAHRLGGRDIPYSILLHAGTDLYRNQVYMEEKLLYADNIFVACEFNREFIHRRFPRIYPLIEHKIRLHHLGLDFSEHPFTLAGRKEETVLCVGRFDKLKGFDYVLLAAEKLRRRGIDLEIEMVGDGDEAAALKALAVKCGMGERVRFPGWLPFSGVQSAMRNATMLVHPSPDIGDAVPTVIKEAAALGLPVIATRVAGIPELLDQGRCGILVPPRDVTALADAMETYLKNKALRTDYAVAARAYAEERFDLWVNGRALARELSSTVRGSHVPI
jgi:glycosyltransferase involved in cell wall biosynthesis